VHAVRAYDTLRLEGAVDWGPWRLESDRQGLVVRSRRPGDRLAGRSRKVQDVLVDAKVPRDERDAWPLVATADGEIVAVVGLEEAPGWEGAVRADQRPA
jgi:tRNA(Ile)-lysidine synthetase-like protein